MTTQTFNDDAAALTQAVIRLAAMAGEAIENASEAFLSADLRAAEAILVNDRELDQLASSIEKQAFALLTHDGPSVDAVRTVMAITRIVQELERIGDNMVNVAKATRRLFPNELDPRTRGIIQRMREQAALQLRVAVQAFAERDSARAAALPDMDDVMDDLEKELFQVVLNLPASDQGSMQSGVQVALVGRYFERVADHAVNFGGRVVLMLDEEATN